MLSSTVDLFFWSYNCIQVENMQIMDKITEMHFLLTRRVRKYSKFGIAIPNNYEETVGLDRSNDNTLWQDAIRKEMKNIEVVFKFLDNKNKIPIGFKLIECHMIYDVKFDLTRKARYVAGGHRTKVPASMTYSSVVSRDLVQIIFLVAALNDIGNVYLNAKTRQRLWFKAGA